MLHLLKYSFFPRSEFNIVFWPLICLCWNLFLLCIQNINEADFQTVPCGSGEESFGRYVL